MSRWAVSSIGVLVIAASIGSGPVAAFLGGDAASLLPSPGSSSTPEWVPAWLAAFDANRNLVDDEAEAVADSLRATGDPEATVPVLVTYDGQRGPTEATLASLFRATDVYSLHWAPTIGARVPAVLVAELGAIDGVVAVEYDYPVKPLLAVSAPATQAREGSGGNTFYNGATGEALGYRGQGMVIAVLDTGVNDLQNAPFNGKVLTGADASSPLVAGCINPIDDDGHGTHVASTALGNSASVRGTASEARLVEIRIAAAGASIGGVDRGLDWILDFNAAIDAGAPLCGATLQDRIDVATISFGSAGRGGPNAGTAEALVSLLAARGVVVTIAVGNCGPEQSATCTFGDTDNGISSPGNAAGALGIASSFDRETVNRADDTLSTFSSRGPVNGVGDSAAGGATNAANLKDRYRKPDLTAPGEGIQAAGPIPFTLSTSSGTSMSTPHVAGIAALLLQAGESARAQTGGVNLMWPTGTGFDAALNYVVGQHPVRDALIRSADYKASAAVPLWTGPNTVGVPWNNAWGYGHVNTFGALCWAWKNVLVPGGAVPTAPVEQRCDLTSPPQAHVNILNPSDASTVPAGSVVVSGTVDRPSAVAGVSSAGAGDAGPAFSHGPGCAAADYCLFFHRAVASVGNIDVLFDGPTMGQEVPPWTDPAAAYAAPVVDGANPRTVFDANFVSTVDVPLNGESLTVVWYAAVPLQSLGGSDWRLTLWKDADGNGWSEADIFARSPEPVHFGPGPFVDTNEFRYTFENVVSPHAGPLALVIDGWFLDTDQGASVLYDAVDFESRIEVTTTNIVPAVGLWASTTSGRAPLNVEFGLAASDQDGTIVSWTLDYGDGSSDTGTGQPPATLSHTYGTTGVHTALLRVTDDQGAASSASLDIRVLSEHGEHVRVFVQGEATPRAILSVDTSTQVEDFWSTTVLLDPGTHTLVAAWFDLEGTLLDEDRVTFTTERVNQVPTATIQAPDSARKNKDVDLDGSPSVDPDGAIVDYFWELGDGSTADGTTVTHRYKKAGTYTVVLTVTDDEGASSYTTHTIQVEKT